jgi:hypothetical protein
MFNFTLENWPSVLLALVPALLNFLLFIYALTHFRKQAVTYAFGAFILFLALWQTSDALLRLSATQETAQLWNSLLILSPYVFITVGLHFTLFFSGHKNLVEAPLFVLLLYLPVLVFGALAQAGLYRVAVEKVPFWGWIQDSNQANSVYFSGTMLIGLFGLLILLVLFHAVFTAKEKEKRHQALILVLGFSVPVVQGIATQIILPFFLGVEQIPAASAVMTVFSVSAFIALLKYKFLGVATQVTAETLIETSTDVIMTFGPANQLQFINPNGAAFFGLKEDKQFALRGIFPATEDLEFFLNQILAPVKVGKKVSLFKAEFLNARKETIPVSISALPLVLGGQETPSVLVVARDISNLTKSEEELRKRVGESEKLTRLTVDRELKMVELKKEIVSYKEQLAREVKKT